MKRQLIWLKLDNAAKIYPAAKSKKWINYFRLSATIKHPIAPEILQEALDKTVLRFPSISVKLKKGVFWYYLQELPQAPKVKQDGSHPLVIEGVKQLSKCAFRVLYYKNRIAVEYFHALTDGTGGLIFLKTLVAEYIRLRYQAEIPCQDGVFDITEPPKKEELEDSFLKSGGYVCREREVQKVFQIKGTKTDDGFIHNIVATLDSDELRKLAKSYNVTVTNFLCSVLIKSLIDIQNRICPKRRKQRPVHVLIPVNLRPLFGSCTMRNFAQYIIPGIDPRLGDYSLEEITRSVYYQMGEEITKKKMSARIQTNIQAEKSMLNRLPPLFFKNFIMKLVYLAVGERTSCLNISNLGVVKIPEEMQKYVTRFDFIIGPPATNHHNCSVISYNGKVYINFVRTIEESELEMVFLRNLRKLGLHILVQSNSPQSETNDNTIE